MPIAISDKNNMLMDRTLLNINKRAKVGTKDVGVHSLAAPCIASVLFRGSKLAAYFTDLMTAREYTVKQVFTEYNNSVLVFMSADDAF